MKDNIITYITKAGEVIERKNVQYCVMFESGAIQPFDTEVEYLDFLESFRFIEKYKNDFETLLKLLSYYEMNPLIGTWTLNSKSIHFNQERYENRLRSDSDLLKTFKNINDTLKGLDCLSNYKIYNAQTSVIFEKGSGIIPEETWGSLNLDLFFESKQACKMFVKACLGAGVKINGKSKMMAGE